MSPSYIPRTLNLEEPKEILDQLRLRLLIVTLLELVQQLIDLVFFE